MIRGHRSANLADIGNLFSDGSLTGLSEAQLLDRFLAHGDEAAFGAILRRHGPMVLGVCRRWLTDPSDVDDAFQATFLVMVERARTLRDRDVLGPWLHRVAHRVAARARTDARRRRMFEERGAADRGRGWQASSSGTAEAEELRFILDEELSRLTDKYRTPLILCDLEGRTHEQAAAQLRCPVGTVKSRLSRAREQLRSRLSRRGFSASPGLAPATLVPEPIPAVPGGLLNATTRAAAEFAAGRGATVGAVAALVKATLRTRHMIMLKLAATALTAAGIVSAAAGFLARTAPNGPPLPPQAPATAKVAPKTKTAITAADAGLQLDSGWSRRPEPGTDPRSRALLVKLEEPITMSFPNDTPLEEVLKYIKQATAGPDGEGIQIYVDPSLVENPDDIMKTPIRMDLTGIPLRRTLKLIADRLEMGYGVKDGMVTFFAPDFRRKNWLQLLIVEPGGPFPDVTPLQLLVDKAERGEMSDAELQQLNERLKAIEEATKRFRSIRIPQPQGMGMPFRRQQTKSPQ